MHQRSFTAYLRGGGSAQISQFGATAGSHLDGQVASHIGGSARAYQEFPAPLAIPATAEQAAARPVCLCIVSAGRDRPHMPHRARCVRYRIAQV
jgi:hypothetical protein